MRVLLAILTVLALAAAPLVGETAAMQGDSAAGHHAGHHLGHGGHDGDGDCGGDDCGSAELAICCSMMVGTCMGPSADLREQEVLVSATCSAIGFAWRDQLMRGLQPETELPPPRL